MTPTGGSRAAASAGRWPASPFAPPDALWRGSRLPDPDATLDVLWGDTAVSDPTGTPGAFGERGAGPTAAGHRRRGRRPSHPRPAATASAPGPTSGARLAGAVRGVIVAAGRGVAGLAAVAMAWLVLVILRHEQRVAYRDAVAAELDAAVYRTLTTDHVLSVATWIGYLASTLLLGGLVFERIVARRPVRLPLRTAAMAGLLAAVAAVPLRAAEVSGRGPAAVTDLEVVRLVATSAFGGALALRAAGLLVLAATLGGRVEPGRTRRLVRIAGGVTLVASYLVIGHPQATDPPALEVGALAVHLVAVATWFGGVVALARELRRGTSHPRLSGRAVARFSRMTEIMVVLALGSGLVLAEGQDALNAAPWRTGYGLALTVKLCFVGVVLLVGGYNKLRVVPAIARHDGAAARRHLRTTCAVEAIVMSMGVLLMTAVMTSGGF